MDENDTDHRVLLVLLILAGCTPTPETSTPGYEPQESPQWTLDMGISLLRLVNFEPQHITAIWAGYF